MRLKGVSMHHRLERFSALAGVLAVVLWVLGLVVTNSLSDKIPHHPTDDQLLTWIKGNTNSILFGGSLFGLGACSRSSGSQRCCAVTSREPKSDTTSFANLAFGGAIVAATFAC